MLLYLAAFLDFVIFVGYCASAGVYHDNFHLHWYENPLYGYLVGGRLANGWNSYSNRINALVKLGGAIIIMQM